jgi:hypothetical protein
VIEYDVLSDSFSVHILANLDDLPGSFMPEDLWWFRGEQPLRDVDISPANPNCPDPNHDIIRTDLRVRNVTELKVAAT